MWKSIVAGRSSVPKLRSVLNPSQAPCKTLPLISSSTLAESPYHFLPYSALYRNPRLFSQDSTGPSDLHPSDPADTINGFNAHTGSDNPENGGAQLDGIVWSDEKHENENLSPHIAASEHSSVSFDNLKSGGDGDGDGIDGVDCSDEMHENAIDTEKLESVVALLKSTVEEPIGESLREMSLSLHEEFVVRVLKTPFLRRVKVLDFFNWASRQPGFLMTNRVLYGLVVAISFCPKRRVAFSVRDIVMEIGVRENGVVNTGILNKLIDLLIKSERGSAAIEVFDKFGELGCVPNVRTYIVMIDAFIKRRKFDRALSLYEKMMDAGSLPRSRETATIIHWLCKNRKPKEAHAVYSWAKEKNQHLPQGSVVFLINSLCRVDELIPLAVEILEGSPSEVCNYGSSPYSFVLNGLLRIKDFEGAKRLLARMIDVGPPPGYEVFNLIITNVSKSGDIEDAKALMKLMESRGLKPDLHTYTVLMIGYESRDHMEEAYNVYLETKNKHSQLRPLMFRILIRGFCRVEEFDQALKILEDMKSCGLQPDEVAYGGLIKSLCLKGLDWKTAEKLQEEMKESGLYSRDMNRILIKVVKDLEEEELEAGKLSVQA